MLKESFAPHPEVDSTSRRTGLQMALPRLTEANTGDLPFASRTGATAPSTCNRRRPPPDQDNANRNSMSSLRGPPGHIGDLSMRRNRFRSSSLNPDPALLQNIAPRVATEIAKQRRRRHRERIDNTVSGPATNFQSIRRQHALGFTHAGGRRRRYFNSRWRRSTNPLIKQRQAVHDSRASW